MANRWASTSNPDGLSDKLVLTYDSTAATDGVGAQLQRIYGIYSTARLLGASYVHSPLHRVDYQGLAALEANTLDPDFHLEFNALLHIPSDILITADVDELRLHDLSMEVVQQLVERFDRNETGGRPTLVRVVMPYEIVDRFPDSYDVCKAISPFASADRDGRPLRVALHVRRGELLVLESDRMLPDRYYLDVGLRVARMLDALDVDYQIELWTEVPAEEFVVQPSHLGIFERIGAPAVISPEMCRLEPFDVLPHLVRRVNGRSIDCLRGLATADILVTSRSSFSYVGAILNRDGVVLNHPFWHPAPSSWITVGSDGQFDQPAFERAVLAR